MQLTTDRKNRKKVEKKKSSRYNKEECKREMARLETIGGTGSKYYQHVKDRLVSLD